MKKIFSVFLAISLLTSQLYAGDVTNLVSYWLLDEASGTRFDEMAVSNDLTDNNTVTQNSSCQFDACADFELDNSEYLSKSDTASLSITGSMTLGLFFKPESTGNGHRLMSKYLVPGDQRSYLVSLTLADLVNFQVSDDGDSGTTSLVADTALDSTSTWYHIVGTHDADANLIQVYVNAVADAVALSHTTDIFDSTAAFQLGAFDSQGGSDEADGLIDEAFVFSRVLSISEMSTIRGNGLTAFATETFLPRIILMSFILGYFSHIMHVQHLIYKHRIKFGLSQPFWAKILNARNAK